MADVVTLRAVIRILPGVLLLLLLNGSRALDCEIIEIDVHGMTCPFCVYGLEKELARLEGVDSVKISLRKKRAQLRLKPNHALSDDSIRETVTRAGFTARDIRRGISCQ